MSQPTACTRARSDSCYCSRCDLLVGLAGVHVLDVTERDGKRGPFLRVVVESPPRVEACRTCGVLAGSHGRRDVRLVAFLAYFDTGRASNGGTEAINGLIELHRRIARGFRNRDN